MRFLVDANLSRRLAQVLREAGHDAVSLIDRELHQLGDDAVLDLARAEQRIIVTADSDFGTLLAQQGATSPSVILLRRPTHRPPERDAMLILANLDGLADALEAGSIVVFHAARLRVRPLPVSSNDSGDRTHRPEAPP